MRLAGVLLVCVGVAFIYAFVRKPTGGIPGFPQAWRGGPLLLGASFFSINGFYLIVQKRFSLAALLVSGIVSAALTSGIHAYVRSIHETVTVRTTFALPSDKMTEFIAKSHAMLPPDALRQFVEDARASGRLQGNIGFDSVFFTFSSKNKETSDVGDITVILNFEYCPYVHPVDDDSKRLAEDYSIFVHGYIEESTPGPLPDLQMVALGFNKMPNKRPGLKITDDIRSIVYTLDKSTERMRPTRSGLIPFDRDALVWLRDREQNAEIKGFLTNTLLEFDKLHAKDPQHY